MKVDAAEINNVLMQMRALADQAQGPERGADAGESGQTDFNALLKASLDNVSRMGKEAGELSTAFEKGDPNVQLADVMIALQKSSISFQAMLQVRNQLVEAYKEVSRMSI